MIRTLYFKLLRDLRVGLVLVCALLFLFEMLWARVTDTISRRVLGLRVFRQVFKQFEETVFEGPGKIVQTMIGGETLDLTRGLDMLSIGFVHVVIQTILSIWAVGRAAGAIAGEIDRGTMELLLAQPVPRRRVVLCHLLVDLTVIPCLCASMWLGSVLGLHLVGLLDETNPLLRIDPLRTLPALLSHGLFVFALSGTTMWFSSMGRFRNRVLGTTILITLVQFLVNVLGQLWDPIKPLRPLTIFYYFDPQSIILQEDWYENGVLWTKLGVLLGLGLVGYVLAAVTFSRRDLPAPL